MVPVQLTRGWGQACYHGLAGYVIIELCAKFLLSRIIRSVSRTTNPQSQYLEDIHGS